MKQDYDELLISNLQFRNIIEEAKAKFDINQSDLQYLDLCRRSNLELRERIHKQVIPIIKFLTFINFSKL